MKPLALVPDPLIGAQLAGYRILRPLGEGGMGAVYLCEHETIGRRAAAKVLKAEVARDLEWSDRFVREARVMAALKQRNIVDIINFGTLPDGRSYLLLEYLEGESLAAYLARVGSVSPAQAVEVTATRSSRRRVSFTRAGRRRELDSRPRQTRWA